jgi:poly(3-hydroxybutyrate) depolymerase
MNKILLNLLTILLAMNGLHAWALENLTVGSTTRTMIVYAPKNLPSHPALVIACHGANQDAAYLQGMANWESVADTAKFVVVYANGINKRWDIGGKSDLQFMQAIIDAMYKRYSINRNRVYLTGFSMGGMFTYYAATNMADKIAAFAPVSGYLMGGPNATSTRPVPILHTHGTIDSVCVYSNVQQHIDAWVKFNGCNTTPVVIKPYPASKPGSPAVMKRYKNGKNGVEVALLTLDKKGHWWSMDPVQALTSVEVWNFCKRYTLGADAPDITAIEPENQSFDLLPERDNTFTVTFSLPVDCSKVKAVLSSSGKTITLDVLTQGLASVVSFSLPSSASVADGEYQLTVSNAVTKDGGILESESFTYIYGVQEVGATLQVDTLLAPQWASERETVGEGIPEGWRRVLTASDGTTEILKGVAANCTGVRMKYFEPGGDFDAGFYLSARDKQKCALQYGFITGKMLKLKVGNYRASFNSIYWSEGAQQAHATYDFHVLSSATNALFTASSIPSTGTLKENASQRVTGSQAHSFDFSISKEAYYALGFEMSSGWNSVIIGNLTLTTQPSIVETYKGTFCRLLTEAKAAVSGYEGTTAGQKLQALIAQYDAFASTSPSAYTAATKQLQAALKTFRAAMPTSGITDTAVRGTSTAACYDLTGCRYSSQTALRQGIYIRNGKKIVVR